MNRPVSLFPAALLIGLLLVSGCASQKLPQDEVLREESRGKVSRENPELPQVSRTGPQDTAKPVFAPYSQELRIPLWEDPPAGMKPDEVPALTISVDLLDPAIPLGTAGNPEILGQRFRDIFYRGLSPQDYTQEQARIHAMEYRDMGDEVRSNPRMIFSASLNWTYEEELTTEFSSARLLVISRERHSYTGGAHGNYDKSYFVFDRELGIQIGLSDIIRGDAGPVLTALINRELRAGQNLGAADSLKQRGFFVDDVELTENYFLSSGGLGFHWDPYEIAPYVTGYVEILIPYAGIRELLGPEGQHLIREF
ncbi:MAG: RsiV family protein [Treponema sp.]|nr:RsiV family protein [Treponema sp.]